MTMSKDTYDELYYAPYRPLDVHQMYDDRAAILEQKSSGVERLIYRIFGSKAVASIAFAINPLAKFEITTVVRSPKRRKRIKTGINSIPRQARYRTFARTRSTPRLPNGAGWGPLEGDWVLVYDGTSKYAAQPHINQFSIDTISRERFPGEPGGPFEKFEYTIRGSGATREFGNYSYNSFPDGQASDSLSRKVMEFQGPMGTMSVGNLNSILATEQALADQQMNKHVFLMLSKCLPRSPLFGLARSIGELRDYRHLGDLRKYTEDVRRRAYELKDIPNGYLSVQFGIAPLISDILTLVSLPGRVSKKLNRLIERSGKPTSYRTKIVLDLPYDKAPAFNFIRDSDGYGYEDSTTATRSAELRMAINSTFDFPPVSQPILRDEVLVKLYGAEPSLKTLYDLTPWSWLVDWFTGFGYYLDAIEQVNTDPSLINYGWLTYVSKFNIRSVSSWKLNSNSSIWIRPSPEQNTTTSRSFNSSMELSGSYHKRVALSDLGVKTTTLGNGLNSFQKLIISALLAQRS